MTWIDILIVIILAIMMLKGFVKGLLREASELAGIIFAVLYAYRSYQYWGDELIYRFKLPDMVAYPLAFGGIALIISVLAGLLGLFLSKVLRYTPISILDHLGGIGLGFAKGFILICIMLVLLSAVPMEAITVIVNRSPLAQQVLGVVPKIYSSLDAVFPPQFPRWHKDDKQADPYPQPLKSGPLSPVL
ncbi:MAG: CvpA family protein [Firmicutes bacterium]|nr:CvpA family protein [Bacillota bacterium]